MRSSTRAASGGSGTRRFRAFWAAGRDSALTPRATARPSFAFERTAWAPRSGSVTFPRLATANSSTFGRAGRRATRSLCNSRRRTICPGARTTTTTPSLRRTPTRPLETGRVANSASASWSPGSAPARQLRRHDERRGGARPDREVGRLQRQPGRRRACASVPDDPGPSTQVETKPGTRHVHGDTPGARVPHVQGRAPAAGEHYSGRCRRERDGGRSRARARGCGHEREHERYDEATATEADHRPIAVKVTVAV